MATNDLMFDEIFVVDQLNPDGKKFMMTDRINCTSEAGNLDLILDVHSELFKVDVAAKFRMVIVPTFREDGLPDDDEYDPNNVCSHHLHNPLIPMQTYFRSQIECSIASNMPCVARYIELRAVPPDPKIVKLPFLLPMVAFSCVFGAIQ